MAINARVAFKGGMKFEGTANSGHKVLMDSAVGKFGGENAGFRPMELMALSMGGCTGMDVVSLLRKMRQDFTDVQIEINAEQREEHPRHFVKVELVYHVWGRNLDPAKVEKAVSLSYERYCPAIATVRHVAEITYRIEIHEVE
nr:OsmC family protein [Ardenticatena sp.]